jgi:hypothetical protein
MIFIVVGDVFLLITQMRIDLTRLHVIEKKT